MVGIVRSKIFLIAQPLIVSNPRCSAEKLREAYRYRNCHRAWLKALRLSSTICVPGAHGKRGTRPQPHFTLMRPRAQVGVLSREICERGLESRMQTSLEPVLVVWPGAGFFWDSRNPSRVPRVSRVKPIGGNQALPVFKCQLNASVTRGYRNMGSRKATYAGVVSSAFLVLLSIYWAVSTFVGVEETFSTNDLIAFSSTAAIVALVEILIILLVARLSGSPLAVWTVVGAFIVLNAWSLHLVLIEAFVKLQVGAMLVALVLGFLVAFWFVKMASDSRFFRNLVFAAFAMLVAMPFVKMAFWTQGGGAEVVGDGEMTASPKIRKVNFVSKPNVYFIGFESAAPAPVLAKYLHLNDAPLPKALESNGFRILKNAFAENIPTRPSFNALLAMEKNYFISVNTNGGDHLFQGIRPGPLVEIFDSNGYETTTLHDDSFFGSKKGKFVDNYEINREFTVCDYLIENKEVAFFGACALRGSALFPKTVKVGGPPIDFLMNYLKQMSKRTTPQFLVAHISPPSHVDKAIFSGTREQIDDFRELYVKESQLASTNLKRIKDFIEVNDPGSILFVFGDHGPLISWGQGYKATDPFFIQDRYAVLAGIWPPDVCSESLNAPFSDGYLTIPEVARLIIRCLAGGVDSFVGHYSHSALYKQKRVISLKEYVYE